MGDIKKKLEIENQQNVKMQEEINKLNIKLSDTERRVSNKENEIQTLSQQLIDTQNENETLKIDSYNVSQAGQDPIKAMVVLAGPDDNKSGLCDLFSGTKNNFPDNQEKTIGKLVKW